MEVLAPARPPEGKEQLVDRKERDALQADCDAERRPGDPAALGAENKNLCMCCTFKPQNC